MFGTQEEIIAEFVIPELAQIIAGYNEPNKYDRKKRTMLRHLENHIEINKFHNGQWIFCERGQDEDKNTIKFKTRTPISFITHYFDNFVPYPPKLIRT